MKARNVALEKERASSFSEKKAAIIQSAIIENNPYLWSLQEFDDKNLIKLDSLIEAVLEKYRKYSVLLGKVEKGKNFTIPELISYS